MNNSMISRFIKYFFRGLLFTSPIFITFYVIFICFQWLDRLIPLDIIPGLGILIIVSSITLLGSLASTIFARPILEFLEHMIGRIPLVNVIYSSIKDVVSAFVGDTKKFQNPVLVTFQKDLNLKRIGFVTETDLTSLGMQDMVAVYFPDSYGITGNLYIVAKENIEYINLPGADIMKFIISGGISATKTGSYTDNV